MKPEKQVHPPTKNTHKKKDLPFNASEHKNKVLASKVIFSLAK